MADLSLFCPVCLCATSPGQTPAGECVMVCRNEHCQKTVAAAVAADALLTGAEVFERRKQHAQLFGHRTRPAPSIRIGQRVLVETFADDTWGKVVGISPNGFLFLGDGWAVPGGFSFKAIVAAEPPPEDAPGNDCPDHGPYADDECPKGSLFPPSYLARMFWRDRSIFLAELATLTPSQLAKQAQLHVRYLSLHSPAVITPEHQLRVWRRMLAAAPRWPDRQPPLLARVA